MQKRFKAYVRDGPHTRSSEPFRTLEEAQAWLDRQREVPRDDSWIDEYWAVTRHEPSPGLYVNTELVKLKEEIEGHTYAEGGEPP